MAFIYAGMTVLVSLFSSVAHPAGMHLTAPEQADPCKKGPGEPGPKEGMANHPDGIL